MKAASPFILLSLASLLVLKSPPLHAQVAEGQEMVTLPGSGQVHQLTLNTQVGTNVTFPAPINLVTGYGMVLNVAAAQDLIASEQQSGTLSKDMTVQPVTIVHYAQASPDTLVMRAVRRGTPCFLTVRCDTTTYLFKLTAGDKANLAVIIQSEAASKPPAAREVKVDKVIAERTMFSSAELVGILSKARQREFLETVNPDLYTGWQRRTSIALTSTTGEVTATITEAHKWPQKDAIVLRSRLENKGAKAFRFNPTDTRVRVGDRSYPVQLADSTGIVEPGKTTLLDVVLQGNTLGGKEYLSLENDFRLELVEDTRTPPPPNDLLPPPQPLLPHVEMPAHASAQDPAPTVFYDGKVILPDSPDDRRAPLPNLYPNN